MKRRGSGTNPRIPFPVRSSSQRVLRGIKSSESQFHSAPSQPAKADAAKTSEFAAFKKLKDYAGVKFDSRPKMEIQSKKIKQSDCFRERTNVGENSPKETNAFFLVGNTTPINFDSVPSIPGTLYEYSEVFHRKRQKLRQYVTEISFPEIGELCSKGHDFVCLLLSRLIPQNSENSSDNHFGKLQEIPARSFIELEYQPCLDNDSSSCWLNGSCGRMLPNDDLCTNNTNMTHQHRIKGSNCESAGRATLWDGSDSNFGIPLEKYRSVTLVPFEELDDICEQDDSLLVRERNPLLLGWDSGNEKDERNSVLLVRERNPLLLGWDSGNTNQSTVLNVSSTPSTSWDDDDHSNLDNDFGSIGFYSFASPSYGRKFSALPCSSLPSYKHNEFGRHTSEQMEDIADVLKHIPLALSDTPNYLTPCEDYIEDTTTKISTIFLPPQNDHSRMSEMLSDGYRDSLADAPDSSGVAFDFGMKYLSASDSLREHWIYTYHGLQFEQKEEISALIDNECQTCLESADYRGFPFNKNNIFLTDQSPFFSQMLPDREKAYTLYLDKSTWEEETD